MKIIRIVFFLIIVGVLGAGYWMYTHGSLPQSLTDKVPFLAQTGKTINTESIKSSLASLSVPQIPENASEQLGTVGARAQEVGKTVGTVLGTAVQQASGSGSIQEKAFDYGRYLYCQQVVKDYDERNKAR